MFNIIKKSILTILLLIIFLLLLTSNTFLTIKQSIEYKNSKESLISTIESQFNIEDLQKKCTTDKILIKEFNKTILINCQDSKEEILNNISNQIYYYDYTCGSINKCFKSENPIFLISDFSREKISTFYTISIILIILCLAISFFLYTNKNYFLLSTGIILIISSIPLLGFNFIIEKIISPLLSFIQKDQITLIIETITMQAKLVFVKQIIISLIFIGLFALFKIFNLGIKIINIFNKENEKEESTEKKEQIKQPIKQKTTKKKKN